MVAIALPDAAEDGKAPEAGTDAAGVEGVTRAREALGRTTVVCVAETMRVLVMTDVAPKEEITVVAVLTGGMEEGDAGSADPATGRGPLDVEADGAASPAPAGENAIAAQLPSSVFWL